MTIIDIRNSYKNMYEKGKKEGYEKAMKEVEEVLDKFKFDKYISIGITEKGKLDDNDMIFTDEGLIKLKQALNLKTGDEK